MNTIEIPMNVRLKINKDSKGSSVYSLGKLTVSAKIKHAPTFVLLLYASMKLFIAAFKNMIQ